MRGGMMHSISLRFFLTLTVTLALVVLIPRSAHAKKASFDLKMDVSLDGKHVSSPRMIVREGEKAVIVQEDFVDADFADKEERGVATASGDGSDSDLTTVERESTFIEVTATERQINGFKTIWLKMAVGRVDANGDRKMISQSKVAAFENEQTVLKTGNDDQKVDLTILAQRKTL
jgi:hypothetical protein